MQRFNLYISLLFYLLVIANGLHLREEKKLLARSIVKNSELHDEISKTTKADSLTSLKNMKTYPEFVKTLKATVDKDYNPNKNEKFWKELQEAFQKNPNGGKFTCDEIPKGYFVKDLKPTQNDIGLVDSLRYVIMPFAEDKGENYFGDKPIETSGPIIIYNGEWIIDGHHRWSQVYMVNPSAKINGINCTYEPGKGNKLGVLDILRIFQAAIGVITKDIKLAKAGENIYTLKKEEIETQIGTMLKDIIEEKIGKDDKKSLTDTQIKEKIERFIKNYNAKVNELKNSKKNDKDKSINQLFEKKLEFINYEIPDKDKNHENIISELKTQLTKNVMYFIKSTRSTIAPGATERIYMPQTDYPNESKEVINPMKNENYKNKKTAVLTLLKESAPEMGVNAN